jgi:hypothetical protein
MEKPGVVKWWGRVDNMILTQRRSGAKRIRKNLTGDYGDGGDKSHFPEHHLSLAAHRCFFILEIPVIPG